MPGLVEAAPPPRWRALRPDRLAHIRRLAEESEVVEAIKMLRTTVDLSLKEAHDAVEALRRGRPLPELGLELASGLPQRCPECGAPLAAASIRWVSPETAECTFCGHLLRAD